MKYSLTTLILLLGFSVISSAQSDSSLYNEDKLLKRIEILSSDDFEGRKTGEKGNDSARAYIIKEFKAMNIQSYQGHFEHPFTFTSNGTTFKANNILAEIKGTEQPENYIVISAHHDHLGMDKNGAIYNGADDDASGVAALLSFAEYFNENPPKHSVILAAFDAEELGLSGSKHFVNTVDKSKILCNLNMDMISRSKNDELYAVGARYHKGLETILNNFENPTTTSLLQGHDGTDGKQDWTMSSDHAPFHMAKIPFIYFGNEDHAAYHRASDVFEDITPEFYKNAVTIIISIFADIDASGI